MSDGEETRLPLRTAFPPQSVPGHDLFPDMISGDEVDRRINSSETRIKFWVAACVASNLVLAVPVIFYMGQMSQSVQTMASSVQDLQSNQKSSDTFVRDRLVWEARIEASLRSKGIPIQ